jgi:phosphomannomutase/phosphoglucomutase
MIQDAASPYRQRRLREGRGVVRHASVRQTYIDRIVGDVKLARPMKIVIDCGNGVAGSVAPELFRRMGCSVTQLFCEVDGNFPNHHPDPSKPENLEDLRRASARGRLPSWAWPSTATATAWASSPRTGEIIYPDRQLMLFAADVLTAIPAPRSSTTSSARAGSPSRYAIQGGVPLMWNTGHALIKMPS